MSCLSKIARLGQLAVVMKEVVNSNEVRPSQKANKRKIPVWVTAHGAQSGAIPEPGRS
jgi:hypothetical protein